MTSTWRRGFESSADAIRFWDLLSEQVRCTFGPIERADRDDGSITLGGGGVIFVHNPARDVQSISRADWPAFIDWWVGQLADSHPHQLMRTLERWEAVERALRVRLVASNPDIESIEQPLTGALGWGVCVAIPSGSAQATHSLVEGWQHSVEHIWEIATQNTLRTEPPRRTDVIAMERHLRLIEGDVFTTGALADLGDLVPEIGCDGALVVAPSSHALLVQPIDGWIDLIDDAARLLLASLQYQQRASHLLPASILWYRGPGELSAAVAVSECPTKAGLPFELDIVADEPLRSALGAA